MRIGLYQKFLVWLVLNVVLLAALFGGAVALLLTGSDHLYPPQLFNGDITDIVRECVAHLQYKGVKEQDLVLHTLAREYGLHFELLHMPDDAGKGHVPAALLKAAERIPVPPYSLCAGPDVLRPDETGITPAVELEAGIIPQQYAIFLWDYSEDEGLFWYARTILLSDENGRVGYALFAVASPSVTGNGHYFMVSWMFILLGISLFVSFLWWCPFVHSLMQPIVSLTRLTRELAAGNMRSLTGPQAESLRAAGADRTDELGSLLCATAVMADKVYQQLHGQRRFLQHIAHELNSPLARLKLGLAVLEQRTEGATRNRVETLTVEMEQLSVLVEDVLSFLRAEAIPEEPRHQRVLLRPLLEDVIRHEGSGADVRLYMDADDAAALGDPACLSRAFGNIVRNAVRYAGQAGPVDVRVSGGAEIVVTVQDSGDGVDPADLPHITEPFYRGRGVSARQSGSGLGLSIVAHCVEACGGKLHCANVAPRGFRVRVTLRPADASIL